MGTLKFIIYLDPNLELPCKFPLLKSVPVCHRSFNESISVAAMIESITSKNPGYEGELSKLRRLDMHMDEEGDQVTLVKEKTYYLKENEHKILKHLGLQSQGNDYTFRFLIM